MSAAPVSPDAAAASWLGTLPLASAIMYAVALVLALAGIALLVSLVRPAGPAKVYVYRMAGIMLAAAAIVLAFSATAMWQWSVETPPLSPIVTE